MTKSIKHLLLVISILIAQQTNAQQYNGYTLYSLQNASAAYLMDTNQTTYHSWTSLTAATGYSSYLMPGGILVRAAKATGTATDLPMGPICGKVQKHDYSGGLIWDYTYSSNNYCSHHDICPMPNGNVLLIAYERKTAAEVTAAGGTQSIAMWPDHIVEVQPTGATTGTIVWEWHAWDHLVQETNSSAANYQTSVLDHPELLNINYKQTSDWLHMNGVDYNPILDQVAFSSHNMNQWFIIDHSTTTAEASSHSGGNSGKGGDILYRWGNSAGYNATGTAILNVTHDAHWIPEGCPNAGRLVGFNNKGVSSSQSSVDQIVTPVNGYTYNYTVGQAMGPTTYTDRHACNGYSSNMGNSQQLPNGNMLVCIATSGKVYEINSAGTQLWTKSFTGGACPQAFKYNSCYINNPAPAIPTISQSGATLTSSSATTYQWYLNGVQIIGATSMTYTPTTSGVYIVRITDVNGCVNEYSKGLKFVKYPAGLNAVDVSNAITIYPNPSQGILNIKDEHIFTGNFIITIIDQFGQVLLHSSNSKSIDISSLVNGMYTIQISSEKGNATKKISLLK